MTNTDDMKRLAARAALAELPDRGIIGLGTGSTTQFFVEALAEAVRAGRRYVGVPTSAATRRHAAGLGIPLLPDEGPWEIAVTVDGADEVDPALDLIKGGGGAHTREKIVSWASARTVIVVDDAKLSTRLGEQRAIPIEVLGFGELTTRHHLERHGTPERRDHAGAPVRTDAGNLIYDLRVAPIVDAHALDSALRAIPGVVETGLFLGRADVVLVGGATGLRRLVRAS